MTRREAREAALCVLFAFGYTPDKTAEELIAQYTAELEGGADKYVRALVSGVTEQAAALDALITECAVGWALSRISRVSMAILRLACYEMLHMPDVPPRVSINEAIELCKKFDEESARAFVNGILNSVKEELFGANDA